MKQFFIPGAKIKKSVTDVNNGIQGIMLQDQMNGESIVEVDPVGLLLDALKTAYGNFLESQHVLLQAFTIFCSDSGIVDTVDSV